MPSLQLLIDYAADCGARDLRLPRRFFSREELPGVNVSGKFGGRPRTASRRIDVLDVDDSYVRVVYPEFVAARCSGDRCDGRNAHRVVGILVAFGTSV